MSNGMVVGRALAPAKINLGLEVVARRSDGFHDISTIMQTVSLFDRISITSPGTGHVVTHGARIDHEDNLVTRAALLMAETFGRPLDVNFVIQKRIPLAAGLGGGSSDAAAAIRLLSGYWRIPPDDSRLSLIASAVGSDVVFFLTGGRVLVEGRGDRVQALANLDSFWVVIVVPIVSIARKTASLYSALREVDFSDGSWIQSQAANSGMPEGTLRNAFERALGGIVPAVRELRTALDLPDVAAYGLSGAGPAHYMLLPDLNSAATMVRKLHALEILRGHAVRISRTMPGTGPLTVTRNVTPG